MFLLDLTETYTVISEPNVYECDCYTRIDIQIELRVPNPRLKTYIKILAMKLYASAKFDRNLNIKMLGADCLVDLCDVCY